MKLKFFKTLLSLAVTVLLFSATAIAAPTQYYGGKQTALTFSKTFLDAASALGLQIARVGDAKLSKKGLARFSIPSAELDLATIAGEILHTGGLRLSDGTVTVELTQFIIDTTGVTPILTGLVKVDGSVVSRIPLFTVALPILSTPLPSSNKLTISGANLSLTDTAATALNGAFGVSAFVEGLDIGRARITLVRKKNNKKK